MVLNVFLSQKNCICQKNFLQLLKNDCNMIIMASRPWANFGCPTHKIYKDFEREPNFFKPTTCTHM